MQRKGLDFHELFDVRAVRVLVDSVAECYTVLGLVHTHWTPVRGEFDDYITNPKPNLYQSLHTAVTAAGGRAVEVQIRTHDMHRHAELGVAAHWRYKEGGPRDSHLENRIGVMRQLLESGEAGDDDLLEGFQNLTSEDRVYVLTPKGEVKDLVAGSTPLDFAYLVHTEVGHRCRGARVNGRIVPLSTVLENGDRIEILTGRESRPSRDWLSPRLGFLNSARARAKVRQWFKQAHYDEHLADGRQAMEQEFKRLDFDMTDIEGVLAQFNFGRLDDLLVAVGRGELTASQVAKAIERKQTSATLPSSLAVVRPVQLKPTGDDVRIEGVGKLLHQFARCCQPVPGDAVVGYLTRARGVSIHRQDCGQVRNLQRQHPERIMAVHWVDHANTRHTAKVLIEAWDRRELIKDIGTVLAADSVNITDMSAQHAEDDPERVSIRLAVQVSDFEQLSALLARLNGLSGVTVARRLR
jgi:GTP pyrophosphokinase